MTFASPWWLLGLFALPLVVAVYVWSAAATPGPSGRPWLRRVSWPPGLDGRQSWRRHVPFALFLVALGPSRRRLRPADGHCPPAAAGSHGRPLHRRVQQHGRHRRKALSHRCGRRSRRGTSSTSSLRPCGSASWPSARAR